MLNATHTIETAWYQKPELISSLWKKTTMFENESIGTVKTSLRDKKVGNNVRDSTIAHFLKILKTSKPSEARLVRSLVKSGALYKLGETYGDSKTPLLWRCEIERLHTLLESVLTTFAEHSWTFYMFFNVSSIFISDFLNIVRKLKCVNISLLSSTFINLLDKIIHFWRKFQVVKFGKLHYASVLSLECCDKAMEHNVVIKKGDFPIFIYCCLNKQGIEGLFGMASSRCLI